MSSSSHSYTSFLNSCLKVPIDPCNRCPAPVYNRPFIYLGKDKEGPKKKKTRPKSSICKFSDLETNSDSGNGEAIRSLAKFYDSIPDYREVNHLPKEEFYSTLESLKKACYILKTKPDACHRNIPSSLTCCDDISVVTRSSKNSKSSSTKKKSKSAGRKILRNKPPSPCFKSFYERMKHDSHKDEDISALREQMESMNIEPNNHKCEDEKPVHSYELYTDAFREPLKKSYSYHDLKDNSPADKAYKIEHYMPSKQKLNETYKAPLQRSYSSYFPSKIDNYNDLKKLDVVQQDNLKFQPTCPKPITEIPTINRESPSNESITSGSSKRKSKVKVQNNEKIPFSFLGVDQDSIQQRMCVNKIPKSSPSPVHPVARPNLAATLRVEVSRKKIKKLENNCTYRDVETPQVDWEVRKTPAWKSLGYQESHKNILSMRLATRKAEQRLQESQYNLNMELMRQRVKSAPLLLEGNTYWGPHVGKLSHTCHNENINHVCPQSKRKSKKSRKHSHCSRKTISRNSDLSTNLNSDDLLNSADRAYL